MGGWDDKFEATVEMARQAWESHDHRSLEIAALLMRGCSLTRDLEADVLKGASADDALEVWSMSPEHVIRDLRESLEHAEAQDRTNQAVAKRVSVLRRLIEAYERLEPPGPVAPEP